MQRKDIEKALNVERVGGAIEINQINIDSPALRSLNWELIKEMERDSMREGNDIFIRISYNPILGYSYEIYRAK